MANTKVSTLPAQTQLAVLVKFGRLTHLTEDQMSDVAAFVCWEEGKDTTLLHALGRVKEVNSLSPDVVLQAIKAVRALMKDGDDWPEVVILFRQWFDNRVADGLAEFTQRKSKKKTTRVKEEPKPEPHVSTRFCQYGELAPLTDEQLSKLAHAVGLASLALPPLLANADDLKMAKARTVDIPSVSEWLQVVCTVPGLAEKDEFELSDLLIPLMSIETDHIVEKEQAIEAALFGQVTASNEGEKEEVPHFEPGEYANLPSSTYHAVNGFSSSQIKDARKSLLYFHGRHIAKTITRERTTALDVGSVFHTLCLEPEKLDEEYKIEPIIPENAIKSRNDALALIDKENVNRGEPVTDKDIQGMIDRYYDAELPKPLDVKATGEELERLYESLPPDYQVEEELTDKKRIAAIKLYNKTCTTRPPKDKGRTALLEHLRRLTPEVAASIEQIKPRLPKGGTLGELAEVIRENIDRNAVFAWELKAEWTAGKDEDGYAPDGRLLVAQTQLQLARNMQAAVADHKLANSLLNHPDRKVEVSYFFIDPVTQLELKVRPDVTIDVAGERIGLDVKSVSLPLAKDEDITQKLFAQIVNRDYHLSAAMYCEGAKLDHFYWIFVNKEPDYHWIAVVAASQETLALGQLEYHRVLDAIATAQKTGIWPAPFPDTIEHELSRYARERLRLLSTVSLQPE